MRKLAAYLLTALMLFFSFFPCNAWAQKQAQQSNKGFLFNIKMFPQDVILNYPINEYHYWLELIPGIEIRGAAVDLSFSCSETIKKDLSTITVSINGVPVASSHIFKEDLPSRLFASIPPELFVDGINEIKISTIQRSTNKECNDVDNQSNWVALHKNSVIHLRGELKPAELDDYPYPFINKLMFSPINTHIVLPENPSEEEIEAMLDLASDWGKKTAGGSIQGFKVVMGKPAENKNAVILSAGLKQEGINKGEGYVKLDPRGNGLYSLIIGGRDASGLKKAVSFVNSKFINQADKNEVVVSELVGAENSKKESASEIRNITLEDLGYGEISLLGVFHQRTMITVKRPSGWTVGPGSFIELFFRHSSMLNPERSAVTVFINGRPLKSVPLNGSNAERGVLKVEIPKDELDEEAWNIEFEFYHDIGNVDCSKKYEEVAWSVIEKNTRIYLAPGKIKAALNWADFPNFDLESNSRCAVMLPEKPTRDELTLAFIMAVRLGQAYENKIDWKVYLGERDKLKKEKNLLIITRHDDIEVLKKEIPSVAFYRNEKGTFEAEENFSIPSSYLSSNTICQVIPSEVGGLIYFISVPNAQGVKNMVNIFASPGKISELAGEVVLINPEGKILGLNASKETEKRESLGFLLNLGKYIPEDKVQIVYVMLLSAALLGTAFAIWRFIKRNR
ncbi:MAG TPA: hypothetical protein DEA47_06200 [Peptococcaceae bacterium]|nr:MAG: Bacterial cellulose synthase subunit [Clostridia bacterium 41_269]HBT20931.1 hypothetical protein [Peptococcaceae bacterium]